MTTISTKPCCITCRREITIFKCENCCRTSCNGIGEQSTEASLNQQQQRHALIQQADDWECKAVKQIQQTAGEARKLIAEHTTGRHRVTRWPKGASQGSFVVGGNERGAQPNQFNNCYDLSFDRKCNLYVSDHNNHRVQKFTIDPNLIE